MGRSADVDMCRKTRANGDEIRDLPSAAGFELQEVVATGLPLSLLAEKAHHQPRVRGSSKTIQLQWQAFAGCCHP
jgi:hypothetical protein